MLQLFRVRFRPGNRTVTVAGGTTLLEVALAAGVIVDATCGGQGTCGQCRVRVLTGKTESASPTTKLLSEAETAQGWVLACRTTVATDMVVEVPATAEAAARKTELGRTGRTVRPEPAVTKVPLELAPPSLADSRSDGERLSAAVSFVNCIAGPELLGELPAILRQENFRVTAVMRGKDLLWVEPGNTSANLLGLAVDIGTTTLAAFLVDLKTGAVAAVLSDTNPQQAFGADVISRINYAARSRKNLDLLRKSVVSALNGLVKRLSAQAGTRMEDIYEAVVVGNTTMSHLFLGADPTHLAPAPFIPAFTAPVEAGASALGLNINRAGRVQVLPNIAGYVGSDTVGVMLAAGLDRGDNLRLAIDIGTNGEVVLAGRGRLLTCSTAAGPAFEGAQIRCGMRAAEGAIETVTLSGGTVKVNTVGGGMPKGICGSGLVDAVAALYRAGVIDAGGRLARQENSHSLPGELPERLRQGPDGPEFVLSADGRVAITQKDIRELQLAKGAIHAGVQILLGELKVGAGDIEEVLLAGAFGNFISKQSALAIGLLPAVEPERIKPIGNAAGDGAYLALISKTERERAFALARKAEHVELSGRKDFQEQFIDSLGFPPQH
jgi:uncharacterized 2Fe-2S/4Fe-4S cluster protein (DUF4445 family)